MNQVQRQTFLSLPAICLFALLVGGGGAVAAEPASTAPMASAVPEDRIVGYIAEAAQRFGIPPNWIRAVMQVESDGDIRSVSPKGAMGLMQIMPETWSELRERVGLGTDPFDPHDNILAGAAYLRELHDRYGSPGFLAAYNAGPERWGEHLLTGEPLPQETQAYVDQLVPIIRGVPMAGTGILSPVMDVAAAPLFPRTTVKLAVESTASHASTGGLFASSWRSEIGR